MFLTVTVLFALIALALNVFLDKDRGEAEGIYRVEAKRLCDEIEETGTFDIKDYPHITGVFTGGDLYESDSCYLMIEAGGTVYRVEYSIEDSGRTLTAVNCALAAVYMLLMGVLIYTYRHVIVPFDRIDSVPEELARGNLAVPIPEEKSRFLGKFTWGVNLLREKIEDDRQRELSMQRDKKLLLLSLSHDIKTPLSAIKLNARALSGGLYKDEDKRRKAALSINERADEIERFVSQITKAASEDFMNFEVRTGEVFLSEVIARISARYAAQLSVSGTELEIGSAQDAILACDPDRLAECLQNLMENAIKYGDGRRISLGFDKLDGCELITVTNTGCKLKDGELPELFDSFHRGSNAKNVRGNGLGLFICKRLMTLMGGEVYAEIKDGCFCITLVVKLA